MSSAINIQTTKIQKQNKIQNALWQAYNCYSAGGALEHRLLSKYNVDITRGELLLVALHCKFLQVASRELDEACKIAKQQNCKSSIRICNNALHISTDLELDGGQYDNLQLFATAGDYIYLSKLQTALATAARYNNVMYISWTGTWHCADAWHAYFADATGATLQDYRELDDMQYTDVLNTEYTDFATLSNITEEAFRCAGKLDYDVLFADDLFLQKALQELQDTLLDAAEHYLHAQHGGFVEWYDAILQRLNLVY